MTQVQQGTLLEVLKKKMRALKDELEQALEQADEYKLRMLDETRKREEVSSSWLQSCVSLSLSCLSSLSPELFEADSDATTRRHRCLTLSLLPVFWLSAAALSQCTRERLIERRGQSDH